MTLSFDKLANRVKEAAGQGNLREKHLVTMKLSYKFQQKKNKAVKDKVKDLLTITEEQLERW